MFDKILDKANEAITRMSKTLTMFEKEFTDLKAKFTEEFKSFQDRSDSKIKGQKEDLEKIFAEYKGKTDALAEVFRTQISEMTTTGMDLYGLEMKKRFEGLYIQYEKEARNRAMQTFDAGMVDLFDKYGDKIAPLMFRALTRFIFRIKKK